MANALETAADARLMLTIPEAARALGIAENTLRAEVAAGELPVVRFGRAIRLPVVALNEWILRRQESYTGDVWGERGGVA